MEKQCIVLYSDGLDSRLAVKIMQEQGFKVLGLLFKLPFSKDVGESATMFAKAQNFDLEVVDCIQGDLLKDYLSVIRDAKYGCGAGANACIDCKVFLLSNAKKIADAKGIDLIVTGEVLGERPMSQMQKSLEIIERDAGLQKRLLRPLSAKLFPSTNAEDKGIVKREKLYSIQGRKREPQFELAKKFGISFPTPGGGCVLCEKELLKRFRYLLNRGLNSEEIKIVNVGRHFVIDDCWIVLGRNEKENKTLEELPAGEKFIPEFIGPSAAVLDKLKTGTETKVWELIKAYSKAGSQEDKTKFEEFKI